MIAIKTLSKNEDESDRFHLLEAVKLIDATAVSTEPTS